MHNRYYRKEEQIAMIKEPFVTKEQVAEITKDLADTLSSL